MTHHESANAEWFRPPTTWATVIHSYPIGDPAARDAVIRFLRGE